MKAQLQILFAACVIVLVLWIAGQLAPQIDVIASLLRVLELVG